MKRVSLRDQFHGEPDPNQQSIATSADENDQIILQVVGGAISFVVPSNVPDEEVTKDEYLDRFVNCTLQLENGAQVLVWINAGAYGVEVQVEPAPQERKRAKRRASRQTSSDWR